MLKPLLTRLDELSKLSTQGEWEELYDGNDPENGLVDVISNNDGEVIFQLSRNGDAEFIAFVHNAYPLLRAEIERLQEVERKYELKKGEVRLNADGKSITLDISAWQDKGIAPSRAMQMITDMASRVMYPPNDMV